MALPLRFVPKNIKSKHQMTNKSQMPISNDQNLTRQDIVCILDFWSRAAQAFAPRVEYWNLRFICHLVLGIWDLSIRYSAFILFRHSQLSLTPAMRGFFKTK